MLDSGLGVNFSILDRNFNYVYISRSTLKNLGISDTEIQSCRDQNALKQLLFIKGYLTEKDVEEISKAQAEHLKSGRSGKFEKTLRLQDGRAVRIERTTLQNGYTISVANDITNLIDQEQMLEKSLYLGKAGYWEYDIKSKVVRLSNTMRHHFAEQDLKLVKDNGIRSLILLSHPEDRANMIAEIRKSIRKPGRFRYEVRTKASDGIWHWSQAFGEVTTDTNGSPDKIRVFVKNITEERQKEEELRNAKRQAEKASQAHKLLANTDELTSLPNRRAFFQLTQNLFSTQKSLFVAYVDLVKFKPINDQFGHHAGDALLQEVSSRLCSFPEVEFVARIGGDEFVIVSEFGGSSDAAERLVAGIHKKIISEFNFEGKFIEAGASIGFAQSPEDVSDNSQLLFASEKAMRRAKAESKNWLRYDPSIDNLAVSTTQIENAFKGALTHGNIRAAIQPFANAHSFEIEGYELLSRWVDSGFEYGDPTPDQFIPIAENLGLLNELLWKTLNQALSHPKIRNKYLSVNISPSQILTRGFLDVLSVILTSHDFPRENLIIEITEKVALRNLKESIQVLQQARDMGVKIALDDFGTGYSSLSIISKLPLDKIKIDQSLLKPNEDINKEDILLKTAIEMANQLDLECCVEGVESKLSAIKVAKLGAQEIQGYFIGRPEIIYSDLEKKKVA